MAGIRPGCVAAEQHPQVQEQLRPRPHSYRGERLDDVDMARGPWWDLFHLEGSA